MLIACCTASLPTNFFKILYFYIPKWFLGEQIDAKYRCKECDGKKITRQKKILEVHIEKGMKDGTEIRMANEGTFLYFLWDFTCTELPFIYARCAFASTIQIHISYSSTYAYYK